MQIDNPQGASGLNGQKARKPRLRVAFTVSGLLIAGCAFLLGQPGNAQSSGTPARRYSPDVRIERCAAATR